MAHYDLEEQEQIDSIKTWWKMYGNLVTGVILAGSLSVIGWQGWNWYQRSQSAQASAIYAVLEQAVATRDAQRVKAAAGELAEKFGGTPYSKNAGIIDSRPGAGGQIALNLLKSAPADGSVLAMTPFSAISRTLAGRPSAKGMFIAWAGRSRKRRTTSTTRPQPSTSQTTSARDRVMSMIRRSAWLTSS